MRSAIPTVNAGHRCRDQSGRYLAATLLLQLTRHIATTSIACCRWFAPIITVIRQPLAKQRLRWQLAQCRLTVPLLRRFAPQEVSEIGRASNVLRLHAELDAGDVWRKLRAPCLNGNRAGFDAVCTLMRHGIVKPDQFGPDGDALLHAVIRSGIAAVPHTNRRQRRDVSMGERIRSLTSLGADPNQPNLFGDVPLQLAWERDSELGSRAAIALLEAGCDPMKRDQFGLTLLHRAARSNNLVVVRAWCDSGLQTSPTGGLRDGQALLQTPLMFAVMAGHRRCADVLIDKERRAIALGEMRIIEGQRLIEQARQQAEYDVAQIKAGQRLMVQGSDLIAGARASLDFADSCGATALHWAIDYGRPDLAELLLACGADRGKRAGLVAQFSWTCSQLAAARAHLQSTRPILSLLLEYGVHPDQPLFAVDQSGWRRACNNGFQH